MITFIFSFHVIEVRSRSHESLMPWFESIINSFHINLLTNLIKKYSVKSFYLVCRETLCSWLSKCRWSNHQVWDLCQIPLVTNLNSNHLCLLCIVVEFHLLPRYLKLLFPALHIALDLLSLRIIMENMRRPHSWTMTY